MHSRSAKRSMAYTQHMFTVFDRWDITRDNKREEKDRRLKNRIFEIEHMNFGIDNVVLKIIDRGNGIESMG